MAARNTRLLATAAATLGLAALGFGLFRIFGDRFALGGEHAAYSTFSSEPDGARAVHDAMARTGRIEVSRNLMPLRSLSGDPGTTMVFAGAGAAAFGPDTEENFERFESMMRAGVRVVMAVDAASIPSHLVSGAKATNPWARPGDEAARDWLASAGRAGDVPRVTAGERWGVRFEAVANPDRLPADGYEVVAAAGGPPAAPRWMSVWRWADPVPGWRTLASAGGKPVIVERAFGEGSLMLLSDSSYLANESLSRAPDPTFLAWLLARDPRLVFDETLHGSLRSPGVMSLVRRYNLLGFLAGALVLLVLFVWRSGTSLVPIHDSLAEARHQPLRGGSGAEGLAGLLRQAVPPRKLLRAGFIEWAKSPFVRRRVPSATVEAVRDVVQSYERDPRGSPVAAWRRIADTLVRSRSGREVRPEPSGRPEP